MSKRERTRARIVETAAALFKERGPENVGLDTVMQAAGLTRGGFYFHFDSKRALVEAALAHVFEESLARLTGGLDDSDGTAFLLAVGERYLSRAHLVGEPWQCPLPSIGPEVARLGPEARAMFDPYVERFASIARLKAPHVSPALIRAKALGMMATAVGGIVLARLASSAALADEILAAARALLHEGLGASRGVDEVSA